MGVAGYRTIDDLDVAGKRVLVRVDFNVPMQNGEVTDATRIERALPTIDALAARGAKVILLSHYGRPNGERNEGMSLRPAAEKLAELRGRPVAFAADCIDGPAADAIAALRDGDLLMLENTRFHAGEEANEPAFARALAANADAYVNDAFSAAHRAHGSTEGVARLLPSAAGKAMERELDYLAAALSAPERPLACVVGGAKVSTKIELLVNLAARADALIVGGGMANTFLFAQGMSVGASLCEPGLAATALEIIRQAQASGCELVLPTDVVVAQAFRAHAPHEVVAADATPADKMILDIGPDSVDRIADVIARAKTLVWNGPLGAFEIPPFDTATIEAARFAARRVKDGMLTAVAGGGDTVAALNHAGVTDEFSYVSTAGGAFLEWMEGKALPGVEALRR
ncbi:MAG: phosphoglycerate kinase [Alphaproteobacteria bacterium]|nr:phosphoglycerate kinase [Alphaproteobacteria bacterium]